MTGDRLPFNYQSLGGFLIRPEVGEGDALLYKYRKVKRKQISSSQLLLIRRTRNTPDRPMICTRSFARGTYNVLSLLQRPYLHGNRV